MDLQKLLQEYIDDSGAVGASVALIDNGNVQFFTYGKKSVNRDEYVSEETIFEIGSITKVFTSLALVDMVAKGEVQLDDPIEIYLPGIKVPELEGKKITLRHLATHTSGIPRMPDNFEPKNPANPYEDYTVERLYDYLSRCALLRMAGESFEYSNIGMGLLGHILSVRSAKSYEKLIQSRIAEKLGMEATGISLTAEMSLNFASGHHLGQEVGYWDIPGLAGSGALRSNIKDMAQFLVANMGLSQSSIVPLMQHCHQKQYTPAPAFAVGLGWMLSILRPLKKCEKCQGGDPEFEPGGADVEAAKLKKLSDADGSQSQWQSDAGRFTLFERSQYKSNDAELVWHNGGTGGFRSYLGFNPKTQKGVVILSNSTEDWPDELGILLLDPAYQRPIINKALANDSDYLNKFVGSYEATFSGDLPKQELEISVFGKLLGSKLSGGEIGMLYPESYGTFGVKGFPDGKVHFSFDGQEKITKVQALLSSNSTLLWEAVPLLK